MPQMYWIVPVEGGSGNRPDNTLPGGQGGYPSQPIYHPGHPDHGLPVPPARPDHSLPGNQPGIDNALPEGGTNVPSNELPMPEPPADYADDTIVAVKQPGEEWVVKAYEDVQPDQGLPPHAQPKRRR